MTKGIRSRVDATHAFAVTALLLLAVIAAAVVTLLLLSEGTLVLLVAGANATVIVIVSTGWWAFTTRRRWKRWLNLLAAAAAAVLLLQVVIRFSVRFSGALVVLAVLTVAYAEAARRALAASTTETARLVAPPVRPWLLVNPRSGGGKAERLQLAETARDRGIDVHLLAPGEDAHELAGAAVANGADAIGLASGDGSLGAVASVAARNQVPFFCIPTGTRNHFAADLGLDRSRPLTALAALEAPTGRERRIDLGLVNDRVFLNNVSIGAYADLVHESSYRDNKLGTARAVLPEILRSEDDYLDVSFQLPDGVVCTEALVVLVANNPYGPGPLERAGRTRLDSGELQVSVLRARTGAKLAAALAQVGVAGSGDRSAWAEWTATTFRMDSPAAEIRVAIDGEAVVLPTPLEFAVRPGALRVLVPAGPRRVRLADLLAPLRWQTIAGLWARANAGRSR